MRLSYLTSILCLAAATLPGILRAEAYTSGEPAGASRSYDVNYREDKVPPYSLPDPLVMENGRKVRSVKDWEKKRRPELMDMLRREMYGYEPGRPKDLHFKVLEEGPAFGGKATRRQVAVYFTKDESRPMVLLMYIPNGVEGPVPAFMGMNFRGNYATTTDPEVLMPTESQIEGYGDWYQPVGRGDWGRRWPYEYVLSKGYAVVTMFYGDADPDWDDGFHNGVHGLLDKGKKRRDDSWATISAWAWGLSRAMDYLETDSDIDASKVAVLGHSRLGKTALWAGATDQRFAVVISNCSGCCGAALSRRKFGETVYIVNDAFPHWFCGNFKKYSNNEDALPFDQHELIAMIAPRPVYVSSASNDNWADQKGEYLSLVGATPVYNLYGIEGFTSTEKPEVEHPIREGKMGNHIRKGDHDILLYDWEQFVEFADNAFFKFKEKKSGIYHKDWIDLNKNGKKDIYEDPSADVDARVEDLLSQMTLEEKTCQMVTLYGYGRVLSDPLPTPEWKEKLWKDGMGAIDEHLNGFYQWGKPLVLDNPYLWPASTHAAALNEVQRFFIEDTRLGIPVDFTNEGIRGVEAWRATNFPTQLGLGHTWDRDLINEVGYITGREARLLGYTNVYAPILDVGRDQRWGRYEEVYGESPYLVGELGVQMTLGMQKDFQVASTAKHFIAYSNNKGAREGMSRVDPQMSPHEVENIHIWPWREVIGRAGLLGAMASYNDYDGEPVEGSPYWLTERLRDDFGFRGYVVSDSDAVEYLYTKHHTASDMKDAVRQSVLAGLNVRCTFRSPESYVIPLRSLVEEGTLPMSVIDDRVRDILRVKFLVGLFDRPYQTDYEAADREVDGEENNKVALRASLESLVLLKNEASDSPYGTDGKMLPLNAETLKRVAVIGPNADNTDYAHLHYGPLASKSVSVLEGLRTALEGKAEVVYAKGCELVDKDWPDSEILPTDPDKDELAEIAKAVEAARSADVAVLVLGGGPRTCGENKSRSSLELPGRQNLLLKEVKKTGKPVVVVLINGRPLSVNYAGREADAILEAWYPGSHGGTAVAMALLGEYNPGGKLTVTFPRTVGQIPFNFPYKPASQVDCRSGLGPEGWQSRVNGALYDFGHGLSYTTFEYSDMNLSSDTIAPDGNVKVSFKVTNTGKRRGDEVVQLYVHDCLSSITVYEKNLRGFERLSLEPGETKTVEFMLGPKELSLLDRNMNRVVEPGDFIIMAGASSTDIRLEKKLSVVAEGQQATATTTESAIFPVKLSKGEFLTIPAKGSLNGVRIEFAEGTDADIAVQTTSGGGQFITAAEAQFCKAGVKEVYFPSWADASELRILVKRGTATVKDIEIKK